MCNKGRGKQGRRWRGEFGLHTFLRARNCCRNNSSFTVKSFSRICSISSVYLTSNRSISPASWTSLKRGGDTVKVGLRIFSHGPAWSTWLRVQLTEAT